MEVTGPTFPYICQTIEKPWCEMDGSHAVPLTDPHSRSRNIFPATGKVASDPDIRWVTVDSVNADESLCSSQKSLVHKLVHRFYKSQICWILLGKESVVSLKGREIPAPPQSIQNSTLVPDQPRLGQIGVLIWLVGFIPGLHMESWYESSGDRRWGSHATRLWL